MAQNTYKTALPWVGSLPTWINNVDALRLQSYAYYTDLFDNDSTAFKITLRADEENPIYVPSAKRIINTINRYVAKGLGFSVTGGTPEQQLIAITAFGDFFNRERFFSKVAIQKRLGLIRGDWLLYLYADPNKPEGARISIKGVDPSSYFPIWDAVDPDRVVGQQLIEQVTLNQKQYIKRQRWLTNRAQGHPSYDPESYEPAEIVYDSVYLELQDWEDPIKQKVFQTLVPLTVITGITTLPIYHFKNADRDLPFGESELAGIERLFLAINQSVTDEDVALAMQGLGVYVTTQRPVDSQGNDTDWVIGPRRVIEVKPDKEGGSAKASFDRVQGVTSIEPSQDHYTWLLDMAESTLGISDVALGEVDTAMAESGIALAIRLGPLLDNATEKDGHIVDVLRQLFYNLATQWFPAYEGVSLPPEMQIVPTLGPKIPENTEKKAAVLQDLFVNGVIPTRLYIEKLNDLGYNLGDPAAIIAEKDAETAKNVAMQNQLFGTDVGDGGTGSEVGFNNRLSSEAGDNSQDAPEE